MEMFQKLWFGKRKVSNKQKNQTNSLLIANKMKLNPFFLLLVLTQTLFAQNFTERPQFTPFEGVADSSIAFADVDGDNDQDVLITGANSTMIASRNCTPMTGREILQK